MNRIAFTVVALASAAAFGQVNVPGTFTVGGTTTGTGPWNMTATPSTFAVLRYIPSTTYTFATYTSLEYSYDVALGGIGGGSPRAVFVLDSDGDSTADSQIIVHWGPAGSFNDPTTGTGFLTGNLLALNDWGRYDLSGAGGSAYTDRAAALSLASSWNVLRISLIVDTYDGAPDRDITINGITAQVPAPGAAAAVGLGGLAALRRRRR